jgi:predicted DNA-binding transcriptional regulator AlpA
MSLLTLDQVAERLQCSVSHVRHLVRAAELAGTPEQNVAPVLRQYLNAGFPRPIRLGKRLPRVNSAALEQWINRS